MTMMDSYFKKTRRPAVVSSSSIKRPAPPITPPQPLKIPATPTTPKDARIARPLKPPAIKSKRDLKPDNYRTLDRSTARPTSFRELFKSAHQQDDHGNDNNQEDVDNHSCPGSPVYKTSEEIRNSILQKAPIKPIKLTTESIDTTTTSTTNQKLLAPSPSKITKGPLKGLSTSLLDLVRAKEAAANNISPEEEKERKLLGIAPEIVRVVPTVFIVSKKKILAYEKVVEKCYKGLKSNYTQETITECLELMNRVAPEWLTTVQITRGKYIRINSDNYTLPQLLEAIRRFTKERHSKTLRLEPK